MFKWLDQYEKTVSDITLKQTYYFVVIYIFYDCVCV